MEINLGKGRFYIGNDFSGKKQGILFRQTKEEHKIGSQDPECGMAKEYTLGDQDIMLWCDSLESARVLQDAVNLLCLRLNRQKVLGDDR